MVPFLLGSQRHSKPYLRAEGDISRSEGIEMINIRLALIISFIVVDLVDLALANLVFFLEVPYKFTRNMTLTLELTLEEKSDFYQSDIEML